MPLFSSPSYKCKRPCNGAPRDACARTQQVIIVIPRQERLDGKMISLSLVIRVSSCLSRASEEENDGSGKKKSCTCGQGAQNEGERIFSSVLSFVHRDGVCVLFTGCCGFRSNHFKCLPRCRGIDFFFLLFNFGRENDLRAVVSRSVDR